jgi:ATP phosphoribosyltransferase
MTKLRIALPKGRLLDNVVNLFEDAGINIQFSQRLYRPISNDPELEIKIMKPQNIPQLIELGSHDIGFTGYDWVVETSANIEELLDIKTDPVKIVSITHSSTTEQELASRKIKVASEYENISKKYIQQKGYNYVFLRTYGATEVFPPDDADIIIDNTSTGRTIEEHNLKIVDHILDSSTRLYANKDALKDPSKAEKIEELKMLFQAVLDARERVMLEMNIPKNKFEEIVKILPCMRSPTIAPLYGEMGYAVKIAVKKEEARKLIPLLKKMGATDILEFKFNKVVI